VVDANPERPISGQSLELAREIRNLSRLDEIVRCVDDPAKIEFAREPAQISRDAVTAEADDDETTGVTSQLPQMHPAASIIRSEMAALDEIRDLYFKTTKATIQRDLARAVELLKSMSNEDERQRAAVYMDGLAQMRSEWAAAQRKPRAPR